MAMSEGQARLMRCETCDRGCGHAAKGRVRHGLREVAAGRAHQPAPLALPKLHGHQEEGGGSGHRAIPSVWAARGKAKDLKTGLRSACMLIVV